MNGFLRVAAANPVLAVADPEYNGKVISELIKKADKAGVQILAFSELSITAYTCGDLFFDSTLLQGAERALADITEATYGTGVLAFVGMPVRVCGRVYDAAVAVSGGKVLGAVPKSDVSHIERRYFDSFTPACGENTVELCGETVPFGNLVFRAGNVTVGAEIGSELRSAVPPSSVRGALVTVNLAASAEVPHIESERRTLVLAQSLRTVGAYVYADAGVGESSTDLSFGGHAIIAEAGETVAENRPYEPNELTVADIDTEKLTYLRAKSRTEQRGAYVDFTLGKRGEGLLRNISRTPFVPETDDEAERILCIQTAGLLKRMRAINAKKLVIGVSGGLDSALALLVCLRAADKAGMSRGDVIAVSMPCFGTSQTTARNAASVCRCGGTDYRIVNIKGSVNRHLREINHDTDTHDTAYENAQARMRTAVLMDIANSEGGLAVGTGDLSEAALGWCTYNGDHMSMYSVNSSVPKTAVKRLVAYEAERAGKGMGAALRGILATEISPELLPAENGKITQKTEDIIGPFEHNDFFLYRMLACGSSPETTMFAAAAAFGGNPLDYADELLRFYKRFFAAQFKRSCSPDGVKAGLSFSPRGEWSMPSDASVNAWIKEIERLKENK